jgi:hypothetical protein
MSLGWIGTSRIGTSGNFHDVFVERDDLPSEFPCHNLSSRRCQLTPHSDLIMMSQHLSHDPSWMNTSLPTISFYEVQ